MTGNNSGISKPTDAELEILQILWQLEPASVRQINGILNEKAQKTVGYTTTLKMMQIMFAKKLLVRDESQRTHLYSSIVKEKETRTLLLDNFLDKAFGGSALKLVMQALGNKRTSVDEITKIRKFLDKIEGGDDV